MNNQASLEVIVLGMHRSGTSMVAGMLHYLGVSMGEDYPGRQISNPQGHFEDGEFLFLNVGILKAAGGSWDQPPSPESIAAQDSTFQAQIKKMIKTRKRMHRGGVWGWKDPRTSLTIPLFLPHLENPHLIWCQRDPEAIAASLEERNQFSRAKGVSLTTFYNKSMISFTKDHPDIPVLIMPYGDVTGDPSTWISRLIEFLSLDPDPAQIQRSIDSVLTRSKVRQAKVIWRIRYMASLPLRALRRWLS